MADRAGVEVYGLVTFAVSEPVAAGLRGGQRVTIDVRSIGRRTDQWAILQIG